MDLGPHSYDSAVDGAPRNAAASGRALFLSSTPLHTFWYLGLAHGPFADRDCMLALIDQPPGARDLLAELLAEEKDGPFCRVVSFPEIQRGAARRQVAPGGVLDSIRALAHDFDPGYIAVGNDRRLEFYAALSGCPRAVPAYVEDGLFSYVAAKKPHRNAVQRWWAELKQRRRSERCGMAVEEPRMIGGSRAVREAWVLMPDRVHSGLASKQVRQIEASWFARPDVRDICSRVLRGAGLEPGCLADTQLLIVLPHPCFLEQWPDIRTRLQELAQSHVRRGGRVAYKCHPRSQGLPIDLPAPQCFEIPRRLPVEMLAPMLSDVTVVGALTTALVSLMQLGQRIEVRSIVPRNCTDTAMIDIYASLDITPLA